VSGDVAIEEVLRDLTARTVSGDMRIGSVTRGDVSMHSVSGDIDVGIRSGSKAYIDVHSVSGDMRSELDMSEAPGDDQPDVELRAKTVSGDVAIRRAVAQAA
jgi:DUF4097 and DUF4098 domain-containing protein YvlB